MTDDGTGAAAQKDVLTSYCTVDLCVIQYSGEHCHHIVTVLYCTYCILTT